MCLRGGQAGKKSRKTSIWWCTHFWLWTEEQGNSAIHCVWTVAKLLEFNWFAVLLFISSFFYCHFYFFLKNSCRESWAFLESDISLCSPVICFVILYTFNTFVTLFHKYSVSFGISKFSPLIGHLSLFLDWFCSGFVHFLRSLQANVSSLAFRARYCLLHRSIRQSRLAALLTGFVSLQTDYMAFRTLVKWGGIQSAVWGWGWKLPICMSSSPVAVTANLINAHTDENTTFTTPVITTRYGLWSHTHTQSTQCSSLPSAGERWKWVKSQWKKRNESSMFTLWRQCIAGKSTQDKQEWTECTLHFNWDICLCLVVCGRLVDSFSLTFRLPTYASNGDIFFSLFHYHHFLHSFPLLYFSFLRRAEIELSEPLVDTERRKAIVFGGLCVCGREDSKKQRRLMEQFLCVCWASGDRKKKERIMCPLMRWSTLFFDRSASQFSEQSVNSSEFFHFFLRWQIVFNADWIIKKIRYLFLIKSLIFLYDTPSFSLCMQVTRWWWWWWWWQRQKRFSWRVNWQKKNGGRGLKHKTIRVASSWCAVIRKVGRKRNNGRKKKRCSLWFSFFLSSCCNRTTPPSIFSSSHLSSSNVF